MTESLHIVTHKNNIKCTSYQIESNLPLTNKTSKVKLLTLRDNR